MCQLHDWIKSCELAVYGQKPFLNNFIGNFVGKRLQISGLHSVQLLGLTGSGKTHLAKALIDACPFPRENSIYKDSVEFHMNSKVGGAERDIDGFFSLNTHDPASPSLLVLDHGECLFVNRRSEHKNEVDAKRQTVQFSTEHTVRMEQRFGLKAKDCLKRLLSHPKAVFLIVIVSDGSRLSMDVCRPELLSRSVVISAAAKSQRFEIISKLLWEFGLNSLDSDIVETLSGQPTSGFTFADLKGFILRVAEGFRNQTFGLSEILQIRSEIVPTSLVGRAISRSCLQSQSSSKRIIGLESQQESLQRYLSPMFQSEQQTAVPLRGILIEGPSGCGKTLLASSLAQYSVDCPSSSSTPNKLKFPITFISVDSTQIISKYFGQSDRNLAQVFAEARQAAPCFLYFDQIDALVGRRTMSSDDDTSNRLVTTFLVEMDGLRSKLDSERSVIVLGTTSKKDCIDPAILRPGRLDLIINVPLPNREARLLLIRHLMSQSIDPGDGSSRFKLNPNDIEYVLDVSEGFSCADLEAAFREAALHALRTDISCEYVEIKNFLQ